MELFDEENTMDRIKDIEQSHQKQIAIFENHPHIYHPRVQGTILAFNLSDGNSGYKNPKSEALRDWFLRNGFNIRPLGDSVYLMPPLCITNEQLQRAYNAMIDGVNYIHNGNDRAAA